MNNQTSDNGTVLGGHKRFILSNLPKPDTVIDLSVGQELRLMSKRGHQTLCCLHGSVWVSQECDIRDYVLDKGDAFVVTLPGLVLAGALSQARIGYAESLVPLPFKGCFSQTVFK